MYLTLDQIRTFLEILKANFPDGGTLIAEQNGKFMMKKEKHHDTVKNTNAHFMSGTDSAQEIADLVDGFQVVEEHSFNEEMQKYSIRAKLFALLLPKDIAFPKPPNKPKPLFPMKAHLLISFLTELYHTAIGKATGKFCKNAYITTKSGS